MTKLAYHVQGFTPAATAAVTAQRNARMIKTMDLQPWAIDALKVWKKNNPGGIVTYRHYIGEEAEGPNAQLERWREFCNRLIVYLKENAPPNLVDAVYLPFNEIAPYGGAALDRYVELMPQMADHLRRASDWHNYDLKIIGGNWSVTTPHPPEAWHGIAPAFPSLDYLCLHRYSKRSLQEEQDTLYDFEEIYRNLRARGQRPPPLILGEFGVDGALWTDASMPREERYKGWQAFMPAAEYAQQLAGADARLQALDFVHSAAVFNLDQYPPVDWGSYLYAEQPEIVTVFSRPDGAGAVRPVEVPAPPPVMQTEPGLPPWLHNDLAALWRQWRGDDRNEWVPGTDREKKEFWAHAGRVGVDVSRYGEPVETPAADAAPARPDGGPVADSVGTIARWMARETGAAPALWQAVIDIETGGAGLTDDGYPICRFELAQWRRRNGGGAWAQAAPHFEGEQTWQGDDDLVNMDGAWRPIHGDQAFRRSVIAFASTFGNRDEAFACSSWGLFQLMGWHHALAGYATAEAMAQAFAESEEVQAAGYLKWAQARGAVAALKRGDLAGFVRIHNGNGQVARVTVLLERAARRHGWRPEPAGA
ncbi:MAG: N-acetylmuramidase domain-containing protein [Caldilineaceae bacterium]|nr:N-acetylmuramidase domain-containing protein [Caldilineaceae bacterium]